MIIEKSPINYYDLKKKLVLSPIQYYDFKISPKKAKPLSKLLNTDNPYDNGIEPGQKNYVEYSDLGFIRTSCISAEKYRPDIRKMIYLHPRRCGSIPLYENDILLNKDGSIGEAAIIDNYFLKSSANKLQISSGVVRLNIEEINPFYLLALLKSPIFKNQLYVNVGLGITITHARDEFLKCLIPLPRDSNEEMIISGLSESIVRKEALIKEKWNEINYLIDKEISITHSSYEHPTFKEINEKLRLDASTYSSEYSHYLKELALYEGGYSDISNLGFNVKRGPSLQVRDAGRIVYSDDRISDKFWVVIKPVDLSLEGSIDKYQFLGNRQMKWSFKKGDILFSAEGTIGKTFVFCEDVEKITTNIHSIMLNHKDVNESIVLGCILGYLRERGILDYISVGGQGGSLALSYWEQLYVPKIIQSTKEKIYDLYFSSSKFDQNYDLFKTLQHHLHKSDEYGIFYLDMQIRLFKSILTELVYCLAYNRSFCDDVITSKIHGLNFMKSFDSFSCS